MTAEPVCGDLCGGEECRMLGSEHEPLHVHLTGEGRPVLYLHGFPEYFAVWRPLLAESRLRHRAVLVDLPGFNRSAPAKGAEAAASEVARRLVAALDVLAIGRFDIVAHDIGGLFAWQLANDFRERVGSLFLVSSPHPADFIRHFWQDRPEARLAYLDQISGGDAAGFDFDPARLAGLVFPADPAERGLLEAALRRSDAAAVAALYRANIGPRALDRWSGLLPVGCATKVVAARTDPFLPPAALADLPAHVAASCEVVMLDHGKHFLQITHSAAVAAHLDEWLSTRSQSERRPDDVL